MMPVNIPQSALDRIKNAEGGTGLFTGDFTPRDLLLLKQAEFAPVGLALGACAFQVGWQFQRWGDGQMQVYTEAYDTAVATALARLEQEAHLMGADGVINIITRITGMPGGEHDGSPDGMVTVIFFGTAVRSITGAQVKSPVGMPFLTEMDADRFCCLLRSHYIPAGMTFGVDVQQCILYSPGLFNRPFEDPSMTQSMYIARANSQRAAQQRAVSMGATGIMDLKVRLAFHRMETSNENSPNYQIMFGFCMGTCVTPYNLAKPDTRQIRTALSLADTHSDTNTKTP